jgi:acyl-CoA reductase-like NAD-dependent aldehyde dehydrogenase
MIPLDAIPAGEGKLGFTLRVPIGVVGAIAPFNFPLNLVVHKVGPAIAAGCPVVLKPASQTPFSSLALAQMLVEECGLPPSTCRWSPAAAARSGNASSTTPTSRSSPSPARPRSAGASVPGRRASASGSSWATTRRASSRPTATGAAAAKIKVAGFSHAGQSCISTQRVLVHRSIADEFTAALVAHVNTLVVGDPLDEATDVSALISKGERDRVAGWVEEARAAGATWPPAVRSPTTACCARR